MKRRGAALRSIPFESSLRDALGDALRVLPDDCARFAVTGVVPSAVASPKSLVKIAHVLAAATAEGGVVVLRGAGTKMHRPPPPRSVDVVLDASGYKGVVAHPADDLTVTVRAGTPIRALAAVLEKAGQFWPCDAPFEEAATIGGTIASNASGAFRQRFGAIRDLVLGARFITPGGVSIDTGARVVKSVAGYDIQKLLVGSHGTLGMIVETTLKVAAFPDAEGMVAAHFAQCAPACSAAADVAGSNIFPVATTLHDAASARRIGALAAAAERDGWMLLIRCSGNRRSVARAVDEVASRCRAAGARSVVDVDRGVTLRAWTEVRELAGGAAYGADRYGVLKVASIPSDVADVLSAARAAWPNAELTAHPPAGISYIHVPMQADVDDEGAIAPTMDWPASPDLSAVWLSLPDGLAARAPELVRRTLPVRLLRSVKAAFDPSGILDPGRLPGGV